MLKLIQVLSESISVTKAGTHYSEPFKSDKNAGNLSILITTSAGSITVTQQCGLTEDGTFYDPVDASNTALGGIAAAGFTVGSRFVRMEPVATPWSRIKIVEANSAATTVVVKVYELIDTSWR